MDSLFGTDSLSLSDSKYDDFRAIHSQFEDKIRSMCNQVSGVEYAILRAPPRVDAIRDGGQNPILLLQEGENIVNKADTLRIGMLDLAEAAVQTLIQDASYVPIQ